MITNLHREAAKTERILYRDREVRFLSSCATFKAEKRENGRAERGKRTSRSTGKHANNVNSSVGKKGT